MRDIFPVNYPEMIVEKSTGITISEKKLAALGYNTFLKLWSYPNPYKMQSCGKELCDLLIVFDNHIIIFSDKDCAYGSSGDSRVDWRRWYKKAIKKSVEQLLGAKNWIENFPDKIALDAKCEMQFPLKINISPTTRFHLVAIAHGASEQCKKYFSGGDGGLILNNQIVGDMHIDEECKPFVVGRVDAKSQDFVHVFDDASYEAILQELDTIEDFIAYLDGRETLLRSKCVIAASENDMLAQHVSGLIEGTNKKLQDLGQDQHTDFYFEEGLWDELISMPRYVKWKEELRKSYFIDELLQKTFFFIENGLSAWATPPTLQDQSVLFCILAREDRRHRLALADSILSFLSKVPGDFRGTRVIYNKDLPDVCYVLFLLPRQSGVTDEQYRKVRGNMLTDYCVIAKIDFPEVKHIIGIAHETLGAKNSSEDFVYLNATEWTDANQDYARSLKKEYQDHGCLSERSYIGKTYFINPIKVKGCDRNKPCPCGSGIKYKKCCGKNG